MNVISKDKVIKRVKILDVEMNAIYIERLEKFMALVELSYELNKAPRIKNRIL